MIKLGSRVKDNVTGFEGIAMAFVDHLHGCLHVEVQPTTLKDGAVIGCDFFDEQRIEVVDASTGVDTPPRTDSIELGNEVEDTVTGLRGIATVRFTRLYGPVDYHVQPKGVKDGNPHKGRFLNAGRLVVKDEAGPKVSPDATENRPGSVSFDDSDDEDEAERML